MATMKTPIKIVNCRIGSLENVLYTGIQLVTVNCRIGSLENQSRYNANLEPVNCRIGSLETPVQP